MQSAVFGHGPEERGSSSTVTVELRCFAKDSRLSMEQVRAINRRIGLSVGGSVTITTNVAQKVDDRTRAATCDGTYR